MQLAFNVGMINKKRAIGLLEKYSDEDRKGKRGAERLANLSQAIEGVERKYICKYRPDRPISELLTMLRDNLRSGGVLEAMGTGCVFTGGGALLSGVLDHAESLLRVPARIGYPVPLPGMPQELARPEFSTLIGMLLYTHRTQIRKASEEQGLMQKLQGMFKGSF